MVVKKKIKLNICLFNTIVDFTVCVKVSFYVSSRRARIGASKASVLAKLGQP